MSNFVLDREQKVKEKLEMLQSLEEIQVFTRLLDEGGLADTNELDSNYAKLNMKISPLDKNTPTYQLLLKYVANTHAATHTAYRLNVLDIFELEKEVELGRYTSHIPNKMLLWHGSRLTNFVGILSQGLRIAPP
jgi:poly [ADP-ribose] polymerase